MITLKKALDIMNKEDSEGRLIPFSITFCTCNFTKNEGGKLVSIPKVTLARGKGKQATVQNSEPPISSTKNRQPHHYEHMTVNLRLPSGEYRKVHTPLITQVNNQVVL